MTLAIDYEGARESANEPARERRTSRMSCRSQKGQLIRRGKAWAARWWEDVLLPDGAIGRERRYATLGPMSKREAQNKLDAILGPINQGKRRPQSVMTFSQFVRECWAPTDMPLLDPRTLKVNSEAVRAGASGRPSTVETYASKLRIHLLPAFKDKPLREIGRYDVARFLSEKQRQGFAAAHVRAMRATLSKIMQAAVDWQFLDENPVRGCKIEGQAPRRKRDQLSPGVVAKLVAALPEPCRSVVLVTVLTGCRIGEVVGLRWRSVDFQARKLEVVETFSERWGSGPPKTKSSRRVLPIGTYLHEVLAEHRSRCMFAGPDDPVFATPKGTPLSPKNLRNRVLEPTRRTLGLPVFSWHDLRHTLASWLGLAGAMPKEVQAVLGHSTVEMAMHYTHTSPEAVREAMERAAAGIWAQMGTNGHKESEAAN